MPISSVRTESWRGRTPTGKSASTRGAMPEASTIASRRSSFALVITGPSEQCADRLASSTSGSSATRSPSRCEQRNPAASMNARRPIDSAHSQSQVDRSRPGSRRASPASAHSAAPSAALRLRRPGSRPPSRNPRPAKRAASSRGELEAGQHRHRPRPASRDLHHQSARAPLDVMPAQVAQLGADESRPRPQADQRRGAHPPRLGGLRGGQAQVAVDLRLPIGGLGALAGQRRRLRAAEPPDGRGPAPAGWSAACAASPPRPPRSR